MDKPAQERETDQPTLEMSTPDETVDQPQTHGGVPGRDEEENVGDIRPGWDGGEDQERQPDFAATLIHLIAEHTSGAQKTVMTLKSSYEATIRAKDETIDALQHDFDRLQELFRKSTDNNKAIRVLFEGQFLEMWERMSDCREKLQKERAERFAAETLKQQLMIGVAVLQAELVARESMLEEIRKELEECKADKATADAWFTVDHVKAMEYDKLMKRGFDNLLDENKYLAGQLAERDAQIADRDAEA